jgi:hypothetical protein
MCRCPPRIEGIPPNETINHSTRFHYCFGELACPLHSESRRTARFGAALDSDSQEDRETMSLSVCLSVCLSARPTPEGRILGVPNLGYLAARLFTYKPSTINKYNTTTHTCHPRTHFPATACFRTNFPASVCLGTNTPSRCLHAMITASTDMDGLPLLVPRAHSLPIPVPISVLLRADMSSHTCVEPRRRGDNVV